MLRVTAIETSRRNLHEVGMTHFTPSSRLFSAGNRVFRHSFQSHFRPSTPGSLHAPFGRILPSFAPPPNKKTKGTKDRAAGARPPPSPEGRAQAAKERLLRREVLRQLEAVRPPRQQRPVVGLRRSPRTQPIDALRRGNRMKTQRTPPPC